MSRIHISLFIFLLCFSADARLRKPRHETRKAAPKLAPVSFDAAAVNDPKTQDLVGPHARGAAVLRAQILLDRAHFSCGEIDGAYGDNLQKTIAAFQATHNIPSSGVVDSPTWAALNADTATALLPYTITPEDVAGPFEKIPEDMLEKAKLKSLGYESPLDEIAEKFHVHPDLLKKLNPGKQFDKSGEQIQVPNVIVPPPGKAASVVVEKATSSVTALDASGKPLAFYVATIGSEHDPLPIGEWKITGVKQNPPFFYNADLFWDANEAHAKAKIAPGPRNPVGVVWIALSKEHYGIHGTPVPAAIGHTQSHGCIRLTNWDAAELANMVAPGVPAILKE